MNNKITHIGQSGLTSSGGKWNSQIIPREFYLIFLGKLWCREQGRLKRGEVTEAYFYSYYDKKYQNSKTFIRINYD